MATFRRAPVAGATYFFTVVTHQRRPLLCEPPVRQALNSALQQVRRERPFSLDALVLLPDHLHCIWTLPSDDANFATRWSLIKRLTSQTVRDRAGIHDSSSGRTRRELGLWQRRFWEHQVRDETDLARHVDYIHGNPVKHGLVQRVEQWPYSSFHRFVKHGWLPANWESPAMDGEFGEGT